MNESKPYGDSRTAELFIIGHDPRLQESDTEAECIFFMNYLDQEQLKDGSELSKYNLARAVVDYVAYLTSNRYGIASVHQLYVTNLCNQFLPHPKKKGQTVLIPDDKADYGIRQIEKALEIGAFKLILPMSLQVFYHLVRCGFINESANTKEFLHKARPNESYASQGAYVPNEEMSFVDVCGKRYFHGQVAVVPILHVKNWKRMIKRDPYSSQIRNAVKNINLILSGDEDTNGAPPGSTVFA